MAEQLTLNQLVGSSSLPRLTTLVSTKEASGITPEASWIPAVPPPIPADYPPRPLDAGGFRPFRRGSLRRRPARVAFVRPTQETRPPDRPSTGVAHALPSPGCSAGNQLRPGDGGLAGK